MLITLEQLYNVYCAVHYNNYSIVNSFTGFIIYRTQVDNRQLPIAMWAELQGRGTRHTNLDTNMLFTASQDDKMYTTWSHCTTKQRYDHKTAK